jgi:outer membrane beta-barrel protein
MLPPALLGLSLLLSGAATAASGERQAKPLDLGILKDREIAVVQKVLHPMTGRTEVGLHVGVLPLDAYTFSPLANLTFGRHFSETLGAEVALGGGYGFKTSTYKEMESPTYGVAPEAYRFLGRAVGALEWTPIYAKMNWRGQKVLHHNVYGMLGGGASVEQSVLPSADIVLCPTLSAGAGMRVFMGNSSAVRAEIRDDVLLERHAVAGDRGIKQNIAFTLGITFLSKVR